MKIRTRIFLVLVALIVLGVFALMRWMHEDMRPRYMEAQEDTLVDFSQTLAVLIANQGVKRVAGRPEIDAAFLERSFQALANQPISAQIYELHKDAVDIRIYVTDKTGKVLFDSDQGRDVGVDYSQWRDVYLTLNGRYGARSSEFDPLFAGGSTMYIASPIRSHDTIVGVVAVGKPTRNAERFMAHALEELRSVALMVIVATVLIGLILHGWLSRPLQRLHDYAVAIRDGQRQTLPKLGDNEVGQVGQAMDEMRQALDGKTYINEYVQALTHELKSPLAAVRGAAELLEEDMPLAERQRFLQNVLDQTGRMQELIDRLLELAALENRPAIEDQDRIRLAPLLRDVGESLQPIAASRQVSIRLSVEGDPTVCGESFLLHKAVSNLLKNALEFSPAGGEVELTARTSAKGVVVEVVDQGPGIPDYAQDKVYKRFYSLRRPDGRKGSGLGLSFVREIAALHKAELSLQDGVGAGTIARLSLPSGAVE